MVCHFQHNYHIYKVCVKTTTAATLDHSRQAGILKEQKEKSKVRTVHVVFQADNAESFNKRLK